MMYHLSEGRGLFLEGEVNFICLERRNKSSGTREPYNTPLMLASLIQISIKMSILGKQAK